MFERPERPKISWAAKLLTASAVGSLLGVGLCGMSNSFGAAAEDKLVAAGSIVFLVSAGVFFVSLICMFVFGLSGRKGR
jgi:hypothetical protein